MRLLAALLTMPLLIAAVPATEAADGATGLPVPRFASLRSDKAYARTGPGDRYPVTWVYARAGLPVEIIREYDIWRQVRDPDGATGWMNKSLLKGERTAVVTRSVRALYASPDLQAPIVWRIAPGAVVRLLLCDQAWCRIDRGGKGGFILRAQLWGVYPTEVIH